MRHPRYHARMAATDPATTELHERIPGEAVRLVDAAAARGVPLRIAGSVAVRLHSDGRAGLIDALGRRLFRDIDFWAHSKDQNELNRLLAAEGYVADPQMKHAQEWGVKRLIYEHPATRVHIDVFMDELVMAHTIDFKRCLDLDSPTVGLADLLLSKLQIHEVTENDLIDSTVLLADHGFGSGDREAIDLDHVVEPLKANWGFWYTATQNVERCREALARFDAFPPELAATALEHLDVMADRLEREPKSTRWKLRSRVGTRSQWYETVEEVDR
jgi:hypothetical protein